MEFLITEQQLRVIMEGENDSKLTEDMKKLHSFTVDMVARVLRAFNLNLKMLLTWGTSVGGFVAPLDNYIRNGNFNLNEDQRMLVLSGVVFILFFEGKRGLTKIIKKIKEEGIESDFETIFAKAKEFKISFEEFLESFKTSSSVFLETVAYSFFIPIITDIMDIAHNSVDVKQTSLIILERLIASGVVLASRDALNLLIRKMIKRFKD